MKAFFVPLRSTSKAFIKLCTPSLAFFVYWVTSIDNADDKQKKIYKNT